MHDAASPKKQAKALTDKQQSAEHEQRQPLKRVDPLAEALSYRIAFEQLVAQLSTRLAKLTPHTANTGIRDCLKRISEFTGIDRGYLFCLSAHQFQNCYEWSRQSPASGIEPLPSIPIASLPWLQASIERLDFIHIPQVVRMAPEAAAERAFFERYGARSVLILPLASNRRLIGFLGLDAHQTDKLWAPEDISLLSLLVGAFSRTLERLSLLEQPIETSHTSPNRDIQQRLLSESLTAILTTRNPEALWQVVKSSTQRLLDTTRIALYLFDTQGKTLSCPVSLGLSSQDEALLRLLIPYRTWSDPHPKVINQVATALKQSPLRDLLLREKLHTYALFPLSAADRVSGALLIFRDQPHSVSVENLTTGQTLAHILAIALQNLQMMAKSAYALTREQRLNLLSRTLNSASDLPAILASVARLGTEIIDADAGMMSLVIDDQVMISYPYNVPSSISLRPAPRGRGTAWYTLEMGKSLRLATYQQHPEAQQEWVEAGVTAFVAVPILADEVCLGALELFSLSPDKRFSQRDQRQAESIGRQAGVAVRKTLRYAETQQRVGNLTATLARQEEMDNLKNRFIQNISHELRTPLGIIHGYAELLESGSAGEMLPAQREAVTIIASRIRMLNNLVDDLTTLLAAETQDFQREPIDPLLLMYSMLADFQIQAADAGITLQSDLAKNMPHITGNVTNLRRVFDNLVGNAFKATPVGGTITLRMWSEETEIVIEIEDTGIGIPADKLDRIFERFYQVDVHPTRKYDGTGLGLALVKEIIEAHRGRVTVRSQVDEGTTFQIRLPAQPPSNGPSL